MTRFNGLMALVAFLSFSTMSSVAVASDDKKEEHKDKGGHVILADEPKDEKKDNGGK